MSERIEKSFCRTCGGLCGVEVTIADDRVLAVRGDKTNPLTQGFACIKGLEAPAFHNHPDRILRPLKRTTEGTFVEISIETALGEIASKVASLIETHDPSAIAGFRGTQNYTDSVGIHMLPAFLKAVGSPSFFSTMTIDQSAKWVTADRLGSWAGGYQSFLDADTCMLVGINPLVSLWGGNGFPPFNPVKRIKEAKARGMTIIVIDPRRSDTAQFADIFLQPQPGEDAVLAAGLVHLVLAEELYDSDFCGTYVEGLDALRAAVAAFTPSVAATRAGVPVDLLVKAARAFAGNGKRGMCMTGTGPNMARRSNLSEHLYECLNVLCGRFLREGERVPNPGLVSPLARRAGVIPPSRSWEKTPSRVGPYGSMLGQMMSGTLADEILMPGKGQIRALFVDGGNPAIAFPDQHKTIAALRTLDLLVTIDPLLSATARLSHYVLPPTLQYERADLPLPHIDARYFPKPYTQFTPALVPPPEGAEVLEDWRYFWEIARRLGIPVNWFGTELSISKAPAAIDLLRGLAAGAAVPVQTLFETREGRFFDLPEATVGPADGDERFAIAPPDVLAELAGLAKEVPTGGVFTHRLISRRMREVMNTLGRDVPAIAKRVSTNFAFLHPEDIAANELVPGDRIEIRSAAGVIVAPVATDPTVRVGAISMTHCWGGLPDEDDEPGVCTSLLVASDHDVETINAMPVMSAIPVSIRRIKA